MDKTTSLTLGLDVSDKYIYGCLLDDSGAVVDEFRMSTRSSAVVKRFKGQRKLRIALEVGRHSPWLSRTLEGLGHEVLVANPRKLRLVYGDNTKNDRLDAEKIARLARVDTSLLWPIRHRRADTQAALAVLRSREVVVAARTNLINSARAQVLAFGGALPSGGIWTFHQQLDAVPEALRDALGPMMVLIGQLSAQINEYDRLVVELAEEVYPETDVLRQIWGVGPTTALAFVLAVEDPERFERSRDVGAYFGLRPRQDQSGDVDKQLRITKAGDGLVRKLLVQCAHRILASNAPDTDLKRWGLGLAERGGKAAKKRAVIAVARKLAVLLHCLWTSGEAYEPLRNASDTPAA
jgi:transposase